MSAFTLLQGPAAGRGDDKLVSFDYNSAGGGSVTGGCVRGRVVFLVQSLVPPVSDHLMELLMMIDIAKGAAAREIHIRLCSSSCVTPSPWA